MPRGTTDPNAPDKSLSAEDRLALQVQILTHLSYSLIRPAGPLHTVHVLRRASAPEAYLDCRNAILDCHQVIQAWLAQARARFFEVAAKQELKNAK